MKKAKVVNQANKQSRFLTGRKAAWLAMGAAAVLGAISVAVPTSHIPGFRYLAEVIGIGGDATRDLTMADFASYAVGTRDNKITALREANLLSYGGTYGSGGGLSPFSTFTNDRLAEAYAKNSKEAIVIEKSLSGSITPFKKDALDRDVALDPVLLAKGFDPTKISASSQAAHSGAMEALAAAAGKQAEMLGKPLKKGDLQGVASLVGIKDPNVSNIVGTGNIDSLAKKDDLLYERMQQQAKSLMGTSIFGSVNADFTRTDTRIGRPIYGLFKELGNSFFFSRYAKGSKYATAAADIAVAAFDGGSPQDHSIITNEETAQAGAVGNPQGSLNQSAQNVDACAYMKDTYKQTIASYYDQVYSLRNEMRTLSSNLNNIEVPGCCFGKGNNRTTLQKRTQWNAYVDAIEGLCSSIRRQRQLFAKQCKIDIEEPTKTCSEMAQNLKLARIPQARMIVKCRRISVFGSDSKIKLNRRKAKQWEDTYNTYYDQYIDDGYSAEQAMERATDKADEAIDLEDAIENAIYICKTKDRCKEYMDNKIEEAFAFGKITNINSLPKK